MAVASLRRAPSHAAEQVSQLLLGETFTVLRRGSGGEWLQVRGEADGYRGWVRSWHVVLARGAEVQRWVQAKRWQVARLHAVVQAEPAAAASLITPLPWGAVVLASRKAAPRGWVSVTLPGGRRGYLRRREVVPVPARPRAAAPGALEKTARSFIGVPYEWGGRSSWGMDCSGFVQTVLSWHGVALPRDAWQQARALGHRAGAGSPPRRAPQKAGDLAFFGPPGGRVTHVGLIGRGGVLLHALGEVRADRLDDPSEGVIRQLVTRFRWAAAPGGRG